MAKSRWSRPGLEPGDMMAGHGSRDRSARCHNPAHATPPPLPCESGSPSRARLIPNILRGTAEGIARCERDATALLRYCERVDPLYIPYLSLVHPWCYIPCTSLIPPLYPEWGFRSLEACPTRAFLVLTALVCPAIRRKPHFHWG